MEQLMEILMDLDPDIDYLHEENLVAGKVLDSFSIVSLINNICEEFDIEISPRYLVPENFNSAKAIWALICRIREEE